MIIFKKRFGANKNLTKDLNTVHELFMKIKKLSTNHRKLMAYQEMKDLNYINVNSYLNNDLLHIYIYIYI